jgi:uncharacterized protein YbaA (DUF1428 family)
MAYVDGFLLTVPGAQAGHLPPISAKAGKVWKESRRARIPRMRRRRLEREARPAVSKAHKAKRARSWCSRGSSTSRARIVTESCRRSCRISAWKMMDPKDMPFDMKRMSYGGFKVIVDL